MVLCVLVVVHAVDARFLRAGTKRLCGSGPMSRCGCRGHPLGDPICDLTIYGGVSHVNACSSAKGSNVQRAMPCSSQGATARADSPYSFRMAPIQFARFSKTLICLVFCITDGMLSESASCKRFLQALQLRSCALPSDTVLVGCAILCNVLSLCNYVAPHTSSSAAARAVPPFRPLTWLSGLRPLPCRAFCPIHESFLPSFHKIPISTLGVPTLRQKRNGP